MGIYIALLAFIIGWYCVLTALKIRPRTKENLIVGGFATIFMLLFSLRSPSMGYDLDVYIPVFYQINSLPWDMIFKAQVASFEPGFILLNKLIGSIWTNAQFFMICCAIIPIILLFVTIRKYSQNYLMSTLIFMASDMFMFLFSTLRQAIAVAICFSAIDLLIRKKPVSYVLVVLLASTFHKSALLSLICVIPFYAAFENNANTIYRLIASIAIVVCFLFKEQVMLIIIKLTGSGYTDISATGGYGLMFVVYLAILIFALVFGNKNCPINNGLINIYFIAVALQSMGTVHDLVGRMSIYFVLYSILFLSFIFKGKAENNNVLTVNARIINPKNRYLLQPNKNNVVLDDKLIIQLLIELCFILVYLYLVLNTSWAEAVPYVPFFK